MDLEVGQGLGLGVGQDSRSWCNAPYSRHILSYLPPKHPKFHSSWSAEGVLLVKI